MPLPYRLVFTTCASHQEAQKIASRLIEKKLAACVNILPEVESVYMWQGKVCNDKESKLLIKTREEKLDQLLDTIKKLHSYQVPEIQVVDITAGNPDYFNWIDEVL